MSPASHLVSVITPTFNRAHYLEDCLRSILNQTWPHLEAIVVDDGSTDGTRALVERLQQNDQRIRYLHQANAGVSAARNAGLRAANGEYIALLDSDDLWHPWKLEAQLAVLNALPDVGMVWSDMTAIDARGGVLHGRFLRRMYGAYQRLGSHPLFTQDTTVDVRAGTAEASPFSIAHGTIYSHMLYGNLVHTSTVLLRRERALAAGPFIERFRRGGEDYVFHLNTCRLGPVAFLDLPSILYRVGCVDQITANRRNQVEFASAFLETVQAQLRQYPDQITLSRREVEEILCDAHSWLGAELRNAGRPGAAVQQLCRAIRYRPTRRYPWMQLARTFLPGPVREPLKRLLAPFRQVSPPVAAGG